jgi:transposase-like protein
MASSYTTAFRAEAVKLVLEQHLNVPQAAKQLAIPKQTLDKWVKLAQQGKLAGLDPPMSD